MIQEEVTFYGHPNIQSLHSKTVEITKEDRLTLKGDCIIGVGANKACFDLKDTLKHRLKSNDSVVKIEIIVGNDSFEVNGNGDERLTLQNPHDIVIRKTSFVCPRTICVRCDRASSDVPRNMIKILQDRNARGIFRISVE